MKKTVVELFAGVGGFRVGLNYITKIGNDGLAEENNRFEFLWSNQWEPSTKIQPAFDCYTARFGSSENHVNCDIGQVATNNIPTHNILVGGFPCQDYSVARSLSGEKGIEGKKGVLWWQIVRIVTDKKTPFILLENVDRLLKSPSKQRGRDFGIMLRTLGDLGYYVEWRVINAAEYGHPQRRRRVFIFAAKFDTDYYKNITSYNNVEIITAQGIFAKAFPINGISNLANNSDLSNSYSDLVSVSEKFKLPFDIAGVFSNGMVTTAKPSIIPSRVFELKNILESHVDDEKYYLNLKQISQFEYLKGSKKILRTNADGNTYHYSEGGMSFPDDSNLPARTMLTSEGSLNRSTHIVKDLSDGRLRKLTPEECERINEFPSGWTNTGMSKNHRYFMMGNALVCGVVKKLGTQLDEIVSKEKK